jgi:hypothetical protein
VSCLFIVLLSYPRTLVNSACILYSNKLTLHLARTFPNQEDIKVRTLTHTLLGDKHGSGLLSGVAVLSLKPNYYGGR